MGAAVSEGEGNEMRLHLRVGFGWARLVFSPDREAHMNAMVLRAAAATVFMEGSASWLEGGGAGSGSTSGGVPLPDSAAAARAWPGSAGPSAQSGGDNFF